MYKVAYAKINNAGDLFNEKLLDYFNVKYECTNIFGANVTMLGGMLSALLPSEKIKLRMAQEFLALTSDKNMPLHVWGTGFLVGAREGKLYRNNLIIHALRGEKSKRKLEKLLGCNIDVPLCDPGLLAREFAKKEQKKYRIGIIPHYKEQQIVLFQDMANLYDKSIIIDITEPFEDVIKKIGQCETIVSSSLHGLIFSDSLNIPNLHLVVSDKLAGDGFKFKDYYSSYNLDDLPFFVSNEHFPKSIDYIIENYRINKEEVGKKIESMIVSFPRNL